MNGQITIGKTTVEAREWKKNGQHRIYFTEVCKGSKPGQACWDVNAGEFTKVHYQFATFFEAKIKEAFNL